MIDDEFEQIVEEELESGFEYSDSNEDDIESFEEYTTYFQIDDICEDEDGEPKELEF